MLPIQVVDVNKKLLHQAKKLFFSKKFDKSLNIYSLVLCKDFSNQEAHLMSYISDLASYNSSYAYILAKDFFRYQLLKKEINYEIIYDKIDQYFIHKSVSKANHSDVISYSEFKTSIYDNHHFELSFYLTHVYTKISFRNENEIVDFLNILFDEHLDTLAIRYFEKFAHMIIKTNNINQISKRLQNIE